MAYTYAQRIQIYCHALEVLARGGSEDVDYIQGEDGKFGGSRPQGGAESSDGGSGSSSETSGGTVKAFLAQQESDATPVKRGSEKAQGYKEMFPKLDNTATVVGKVASKDLPAFNCVGSAMGDHGRWWFPFKAGDKVDQFFWPSESKRGLGVKSFDDLFVRVGKGSVTKNDKVEEGYVKVALYTFRGQPAHIARQLPNGQWLSKIGFMEMIAHHLEGLNSNKEQYGNIAKMYKIPTEEFAKFKDMK